MPKATTTKVRIGRIERRAVPLIVLCFGLVGPGCTVVMVAPGDGGPGEPATDAGLPAADARPRPDGPPASCQIASCQNGNAATCTVARAGGLFLKYRL